MNLWRGRKPLTSAGRLTITVGFGMILLYSGTFFLPIVIADEVAQTFGTSRAVILGALGWGVIVSASLSPTSGRWIERTGGRNVFVFGICTQVLGLCLLSQATNIYWWFGAWTVLGIGMAFGFLDTAQAVIGRQLGAHARTVFVTSSLISGFDSFVGWPLSHLLHVEFGWRSAALIFAGIYIAICIPLHIWGIAKVPPPAPPPPPPRLSTDPGPSRRGIVGLFAAHFTMRAFLMSMIGVQILVILGGLGLSEGAAIAVAALMGPSKVAGRALDLIFRRRMTPLVAGWFSALLLPLALLSPLAGGPAAGLAITSAVSNGILAINRGTLPLYLLGPAGISTLLGKMALPCLLASALSPPLTAPLFAMFPIEWILLGMTALSLVAAACLIPLRSPRDQAKVG